MMCTWCAHFAYVEEHHMFAERALTSLFESLYLYNNSNTWEDDSSDDGSTKFVVKRAARHSIDAEVRFGFHVNISDMCRLHVIQYSCKIIQSTNISTFTLITNIIQTYIQILQTLRYQINLYHTSIHPMITTSDQNLIQISALPNHWQIYASIVSVVIFPILMGHFQLGYLQMLWIVLYRV